MKSSEVVGKLHESFKEAILNQVDFMGEITLEIEKQTLKEILLLLKSKYRYLVLMDLTGVDYLEPTKRTKVVYWLHNPENLERLRLVLFVSRDEKIPSVTDLWEGADWYERELFDLFGVRFEHHPHLRRILMPDDWQGHPLRKDYALTEESVEFKHGVKPKVPSEIIPYVKSKEMFNPLGTYDKDVRNKK